MTQPPGWPRARASSLGARERSDVEVRAAGRERNDAGAPATTPSEARPLVVRQSGVVPRTLGMFAPLAILRAPHPAIAGFGTSVASAGEHLLIGAHSPNHPPFAALYRLTGEGAVRERLLRGVEGQRGPSLATDGVRIAVGQPAGTRSKRAGFVSMYRARDGELAFEGLLEAPPEDARGRRFGELVAVQGSLLVTGCHGALRAYRHSAVGWLQAGAIQPPRAYTWNPALGRGLALGQGRILIGNPVEMSGSRLGPGRVFVYRQRGDRIELEGVLHGDGLESEGERPRLGFGASLNVYGDVAVITAPQELTEDGRARSRVYVYRLAEGAFTRVAALSVPSCHGGICLLDGRLYVLGDALHVFAQNGRGFEQLSSHSLGEGRPARLAACGPLLAIADPSAGQVALHAAALL